MMSPELIELAVNTIEFEDIREIDVMTMVFNPQLDILKDGRVVTLECGHRLLTKARKRARCPRCQEMLRRSLDGGGEDYDSFRKGLIPDKMVWAGDPLRIFHEAEYCRQVQASGIEDDYQSGKITFEEAKRRYIELEERI